MESVNDIIAEMESLGDKWTADPGRTTMECMGLIIWQLARRLKAACECERESALAAPPRNCDLFTEAREAEKAFDNFCAEARTGKCNPAECPLPRHTGAGSCLLAWLFAPANSVALPPSPEAPNQRPVRMFAHTREEADADNRDANHASARNCDIYGEKP